MQLSFIPSSLVILLITLGSVKQLCCVVAVCTELPRFQSPENLEQHATLVLYPRAQGGISNTFCLPRKSKALGSAEWK